MPRLYVSLLLLALLPRTSWRVLAQAPPELPTVADLNGFVYDPTGALGADATAIDVRLKGLSDETVAQGAVYVLGSIGEEVPKDYAVELFGHLALGERDTDYGFLVLIVLDERRTEIETGYGAEAFLTDVTCKRLLEREFVPRAKAGQMGAGTVALVRELEDRLRRGLAGEDPASLVPDAPAEEPYDVPQWMLLYLLFSMMTVFLLCLYVTMLQDIFVPSSEAWKHLRKARWWFLLVLFPLPYLLIYAGFRCCRKLWRLAPRFHFGTRQPMRRLKGDAERDLMTEGMLAERRVESAEWDVWATPDRKHTRLLRSPLLWHRYDRCPACDYEDLQVAPQPGEARGDVHGYWGAGRHIQMPRVCVLREGEADHSQEEAWQ